MDKMENKEILKEMKGYKFYMRENTLDEYVMKENLSESYLNKFDFDKKDIWLDAGANIGAFTIINAYKVKQIICFEPDKENFELLKKNIKLNNITNVVLFNAALVEDDKNSVKFSINSKKNKGTHSLLTIGGRRIKEVPARNISKVITEFGINNIKMDIEGYEYTLIPSINFNLIKQFIFEFHHIMLKEDNSNTKYNETISILKRFYINCEYSKDRKQNWTSINKFCGNKIDNFLIVIPSKGRANQFPVIKYFKSVMDKVKIFIEPQDKENYLKMFNGNNIELIDDNDRGNGYGRQFIINWCRNNKIKYCLMIDDNVEELLLRQGKTKSGYHKLIKLENVYEFIKDNIKLIEKNKLSQLGISFKPSNWMNENDYKELGRVWACFFLGIEYLPIEAKLDSSLQTCEDFDFTINILKNKGNIGTNFNYAFYKEMASKRYTGGNDKFYTYDRTEQQVDYLVEKHSGLCTKAFSDKRGIFEIKVNWKKIKSISKSISLLEF